MEPRQNFANDMAYKSYLRIYFSAMAIQGLLSNTAHHSQVHNHEGRARIAIQQADELLKQLEAEPEIKHTSEDIEPFEL